MDCLPDASWRFAGLISLRGLWGRRRTARADLGHCAGRDGIARCLLAAEKFQEFVGHLELSLERLPAFDGLIDEAIQPGTYL
ncbi:hypothetical protein GCM10027057_15700 [Marisediminicola antarctica]